MCSVVLTASAGETQVALLFAICVGQAVLYNCCLRILESLLQTTTWWPLSWNVQLGRQHLGYQAPDLHHSTSPGREVEQTAEIQPAIQRVDNSSSGESSPKTQRSERKEVVPGCRLKGGPEGGEKAAAYPATSLTRVPIGYLQAKCYPSD